MHGVIGKKDRFRTDPVIDPETGKAIKLRTPERDIILYRALRYRFHYLSAQWIAALFDWSYQSAVRRTRKMRRAPNNTLRLAPEQQRHPERYFYGELYLCIDENGVKKLEKKGDLPFERPAPVNMTHQLMIDLPMASIAKGCKHNSALTLHWWDQITTWDKVPEATRKSKSASIKLKDGSSIRADGLPFVIERNFPGLQKELMFFVGLEADCDTESMTVINEKLRAYIEVLIDRLYFGKFGSKTFNVIWVAPTQARINKIMAAWEKLTADKPHLRKVMYFRVHPMFDGGVKVPKTGHMISEPLLRVGYPPVTLGKPQEV
jgi:hypothetical protein